jgi:hypothetical protein
MCPPSLRWRTHGILLALNAASGISRAADGDRSAFSPIGIMGLFRREHIRSSSDEKLMGLLGRGDIAAFDELYDRYGGRLLRYFHRMLGRDEEKAQDFLQDIFLRIVERPELFSLDRRFSTWIFSVAHNMCKNEYRRAMVRQSISTLTIFPWKAGKSSRKSIGSSS